MGCLFFPFLPKRPKLNSCFKELTKMFLGSYMFLFCIIDFLLKFIFLLFSNLAIMKQKCWFLTKAKENYSLKVSIKNSGDFLNKKIQTNLKKTSGKMSRLKALTKNFRVKSLTRSLQKILGKCLMKRLKKFCERRRKKFLICRKLN